MQVWNYRLHESLRIGDVLQRGQAAVNNRDTKWKSQLTPMTSFTCFASYNRSPGSEIIARMIFHCRRGTMTNMISVDNYDAEYIDEKSKDWKPCRVLGVIKGDHAMILEFVVCVTRNGIQKIILVETVRIPD
jgi:hypothetical protein